MVDDSKLSGQPSAKNKGFDLRVFGKNVEIGGQYYKVDQGYGYVFPYDKSQASGEQPMSDISLYASHKKDIGDKATVTTQARYRKSDIDGYCTFLEGYNVSNSDTVPKLVSGILAAPGEKYRTIDYSYWGVSCNSMSFYQAVDYNITKQLSASMGYRFEYKDLEKGWRSNYGKDYAPDSLKISSSGFYPEPINLNTKVENRAVWKNNGGHVLLKYALNENHIFNAGARADNNTIYGTAYTFRGGYVFNYKHFSAKALYGEGYIEPTPRQVYGAWSVVGGSGKLEAERSRTFESSLGYTLANIAAMVDGYYVQSFNTIMMFKDGAKNLGKRNVMGVDVHLTGLVPVSFVKQLKVWGYGSFLLKDEEQQFDANGNETSMAAIGDLAHSKLFVGVTTVVNKYVSLSLRGRNIGSRKTVSSNPIKSVGSYTVLDGNLIFSDFWIKGLSLTCQVNNIFDTKYFHPGIREATAGDTPGTWNGRAWAGSSGWSNSLLPQYKRYYMLGLSLDI